MPEIENDPVTWKSFKSLPRLALMTWLIVFAADAIFIARNESIEDFDKLLYIWSIGYAIALIFEFLRIYKKRENVGTRDKGDYLFIPLNALLIFFYASAYNGFTKQVATWGTARDILDKEKALHMPADASLFAAVETWAVPILAQQTSYWPDVKVIAEKHELMEENLALKERLGQTADKSDDASKPTKETVVLIEKIAQLRDSIATLSGKADPQQAIPCEDSALKDRIAELDRLLANCNTSLSNLDLEATRLRNQKDELLRRINEHNVLQQRWVEAVQQRPGLRSCVNSFKEFFEPGYYDQLLGKPIDTSLP